MDRHAFSNRRGRKRPAVEGVLGSTETTWAPPHESLTRRATCSTGADTLGVWIKAGEAIRTTPQDGPFWKRPYHAGVAAATPASVCILPVPPMRTLLDSYLRKYLITGQAGPPRVRKPPPRASGTPSFWPRPSERWTGGLPQGSIERGDVF